MTTMPKFAVPSPLAVARVAEVSKARREAGIVYSTSTPVESGAKPVVTEVRPTISAEAKADARANTRTPRAIRKPRVAKHQPRIKGEPFDPSRVSRTLSPNARTHESFGV